MLGIRNWLPVATALLFVIPVQAFNADDLNDPKVVEAFISTVPVVAL